MRSAAATHRLIAHSRNGSIIAPITATKPALLRSCVFLHGLGDKSDSFIPFFDFIFSQSPESFRSVRARLVDAPIRPVSINHGLAMPAWYDIKENRDEIDQEGLEESSEIVTEVLREEAEIVGGSQHIIIGGFSQGGVLAGFAGLRHSQPLAGIVSMSGFAWPTLDAGSIHEANQHTPFLAFHGMRDEVITHARAKQSYERLRDLANLHDHMTLVDDPDCEHNFSPMGVGAYMAFVKANFGLVKPGDMASSKSKSKDEADHASVESGAPDAPVPKK